MPNKKLKLGCPEVAAVIDEKHAAEKPGWLKDRLLVIKLAARGEHTAANISELTGISRSRLFDLLKLVRENGLEAICERGKTGRPEGWRKKDIPKGLMERFEEKLAANEFTTLQEARRWMREKYGVEVSYNRVWYWAKKLKGVLLVPRPSHTKKKPLAAEEFKSTLSAKLADLNLKPGTRANVWMMDEARFGLHTMLRRLWGMKGARPVLACQTKYEWDYLFGSLEVVNGTAHFCQMSRVNQDVDRDYLANLAATDPGAVHILIRDQAGFHLRDGDPRLPANVRIVDLPPYSPELNPCEQLWAQIKRELGNKVFRTVEDLRDAMDVELRRWWEDAERVIQLIGRPWLRDEANVLYKT